MNTQIAKDPRHKKSCAALYTIGYAGYSLDAFIETLHSVGVNLLVDVRAVPLSHKKGFSKNGLRATLAGHGIDYLHCPTLGAPKPLRVELALTQNYEAFIRAYRRHLDRQRDVIEDVRNEAIRKPACLLCVEPNPNTCHRSATAVRVARSRNQSMRIVHLGHGHLDSRPNKSSTSI